MKEGLKVFLFLSVLVLSMGFAASLTPAHCEGSYVSSCASQSAGSCSYMTEYDSYGWGIGCATDLIGTSGIPSGCYETQGDCIRYGDYGCEEGYETICAGTPDCEECLGARYDGQASIPQHCSGSEVWTSCSGLSQTTCNNYYGCTWVPAEECAANEVETYTGCTGTYTETVSGYTCNGEYYDCGLHTPALSFFALLTGKLIDEDCLNQPAKYCGAGVTTKEQCEAENPACSWDYYSYQVTKQCSTLSESQCGTKTGCTANYDCVLQKKGLCEVCSLDSDCESGFCSDTPTQEKKRCVSAVNVCPLDISSNCEVGHTDTVCINSNEYATCMAQDPWEGYYRCPNGCSNGACLETPTLNWYDGTGLAKLITEIDNPLIIASQSYFQMKISNTQYLDGGDNGFYVYSQDNTDLITGDIVGQVSGSTVAANWQVNENTFASVQEVGENLYKFYFTYRGEYGLQSPDLYILADFTQSHCENGFQDEDEAGTDCGGVDCAACPETCFDGIQNQDETDVDCGGICQACLEKTILWTSPKEPYGQYVEQITLDPNTLVTNPSGTQFRMVIKNAEISTSQFSIKESDDGFMQSDDLILSNRNPDTVTEVADGRYDLEYIWHPTLQNFEDAQNEDSDNIFEFYFEVEGETSPFLNIKLTENLPTCSDGIINGDEEGKDCGGSCPDACLCVTETVCSDYQTKDECNADPCDVVNGSAIQGVECSWNSVSSTCGQVLKVSVNGINIGSCVYNEDTSQDTCDDGFLSYSWDATWKWDPKNNFEMKPEGEGYVQEPIGMWHYDPQEAHLDCQEGEATIPCPAQIQLSFFTWKNLVAAVLLVIIAYIIISNRKKFNRKKVKTKVVNSKKPAQKKAVAKKGVVKKVSKKPTSKKAAKKTTSKKKK